MASKANKSTESKSTVATPHKRDGQKYSTSKLLKSKHLAGYQRDFARVILTEPEYTISGAIDALERALKGGK